MWELIQSNKRKTMILFIGMGIALILLGYFIGSYFVEGGGIFGIVLALFIWFILSMVSYTAGSSILLSVSSAREVTPEVHQQLFNIVEEMRLASNLPKTPKVYIINDPAPNAFATGIKPENSAITVTAGLLSKLNRDELQGVIAHEMSHIANRDILVMTFAGIMLGSIVLISEVFLKGLWFSGGSSVRYRSKSSSSGGGQAQMIMMVVAIIFAILAPIAAQLLYFAISRRREYLADANGARLTRYPEGLASALEKISSTDLDLKSANKVTAPMYIINPLKKKGMKLSDLTSTHPPTSERIKILRSMAGGVNYINYQNAFNIVKGKDSVLMPAAALADQTKIDIRKASSDSESSNKVKEKRTLGDLMMTVNKYAFIACACGLKMKIPPDYKEKSITCPRCGRKNEIPLADISTISKVAQGINI